MADTLKNVHVAGRRRASNNIKNKTKDLLKVYLFEKKAFSCVFTSSSWSNLNVKSSLNMESSI